MQPPALRGHAGLALPDGYPASVRIQNSRASYPALLDSLEAVGQAPARAAQAHPSLSGGIPGASQVAAFCPLPEPSPTPPSCAIPARHAAGLAFPGPRCPRSVTQWLLCPFSPSCVMAGPAAGGKGGLCTPAGGAALGWSTPSTSILLDRDGHPLKVRGQTSPRPGHCGTAGDRRPYFVFVLQRPTLNRTSPALQPHIESFCGLGHAGMSLTLQIPHF